WRICDSAKAGNATGVRSGGTSGCSRISGHVPRLRTVSSHRTSAGNEPGKGNRGSASDGADTCNGRPCVAVKEAEFDVVVIGSGAGGGTMVRALAGTSARVLLLERGGSVPREDHNWSPYAVWKSLRYRVSEQWIDKEGNEFTPYTHYNVGGNTKFWGSVLYRLREQDFEAHEHMDGVSPAWPI